MIAGIGTDLVSIARIERVYQKHGERFARRVLVPSENERWQSKGCDIYFLAKRFAAKEAVAKALGCGIGRDLSFQDIEILSEPSGKPRLLISGSAAEKLDQRGEWQAHLSLSDEKDNALAFVVIELY